MQHLNWSTPITKWNGDVPDVSYFKVFGSQAYIFIPKEDQQNKLSAKAEKAIFIGYEIGTKGYKFWSPRQRRVIISPTATFDEFTFPHCSKKSDDKPPELSIPQSSNDAQDSDRTEKPTSEDILTTHYYQFTQEDYNPDQQIPPEDSPDDQQPSQPTPPPPSSPSDSTHHSPSLHQFPFTRASKEPQ